MKKNELKSEMVMALIVGCFALFGLGWATPVKATIVEEKAVTQDNHTLNMLIGTYTSADNPQGIFVYKFDQQTGVAELMSKTIAQNPSFLVVSADERFVYTVGENNRDVAVVHAFAFDKNTGQLTLLNSQQTNGASPCYINVDLDSRFVVTANYSGGNVNVFPLQHDGSLQPVTKVFEFDFAGNGPIANRQNKPYLHCVVFSPDQRFLFAADLGGDRIHKFETSSAAPFLTSGTPQSYRVEPGSGPRHLTFHPNGKYAYLINELSGKVTVLNYAEGNLEPVQYIASDPGDGNKGSADIHISPDGKFLYASNRANTNNIAIFSINEVDGRLSSVGFQATERHPRNFIITPNGKYLLVANMNSNSIQVFERDNSTGFLQENESLKITEINRPVCIKWVGMN